ncbi:MAG: ATP-binding cassette domain-containing protein, partial [Actinomycetota bacterium]|nr:ATP-binding cassette domain-containing protein [Actinomycetota bacterium]
IAVAGLVKEYGDGYRAVDGVTFRVERGQVVGLLGPNGAGKTTTLRVLVGLIRPTSGTIHVFGQPVTAGAPVLARIGAFIEGPGFLPHLSGRENLRLYWAASGLPAADADFETALDIAGLGASVDRRVKTYSHGMSQRLGIAQAMLGLPEVLVLDEPTNGLDPPQIAEMREVLQRYAASGRTVVVSSHLLAEVEQTCTHVVVMHKGRIVAAGSVADVAGTDGSQLSVGDPVAAARVLAAAGIEAELVPARRSLEDVFLDLIGVQE